MTAGWSGELSTEDRWLVFELIRQSAWADGRLSADELSAARGAAIALDVLRDSRTRGALARPGPVPLSGTASLPPVARRVAFAAAAWIACIDGHPCERERTLLQRLCTDLDLDDEEAQQIVREAVRSTLELRRAGPEAMVAEDWAIEIDGLLAWTAELTDASEARSATELD